MEDVTCSLCLFFSFAFSRNKTRAIEWVEILYHLGESEWVEIIQKLNF